MYRALYPRISRASLSLFDFADDLLMRAFKLPWLTVTIAIYIIGIASLSNYFVFRKSNFSFSYIFVSYIKEGQYKIECRKKKIFCQTTDIYLLIRVIFIGVIQMPRTQRENSGKKTCQTLNLISSDFSLVS